MKAKTKLIIFDIDSTLTNSEKIHQSSFIAALQEEGIEEINTDWASYEHHTDRHIASVNYEHHHGKPMSSFDVIMLEAGMIEHMSTYKRVPEITGAAEFVSYLWKKTEYAVVFATGSLREPALLKLEEAGIRFEDALLAASNEHTVREDIVLEAIERAKKFYQVEQFEKLIAFGDGAWDLKVARALNLDFIGVGLEQMDYFKAQGVKHCIENYTKFDYAILENCAL